MVVASSSTLASLKLSNRYNIFELRYFWFFIILLSLHQMAPKNKTSFMNSDAALKDMKMESDVNKLEYVINKGVPDLETVKTLVKENKKLLQHQYEGNNYPLHLAAKSGHSKVVEHLVETYAEAVMATNLNDETPIYIAIENDKLDSVKKMFPYFKRKIKDRQNQKQPVPGKSLVHAVLEYRSENWEAYLKILFEDEGLKLKLMESCDAKLSPLSSLICRDQDKKKHEDLAIKVAEKYPEMMEVKDKNDDKTLPIHQALIQVKLNVIEAFLKMNQNFILGTNKKGQNILHLAAMREDYCKDKKIFEIFEGLTGIYGLVREKGENERTPLELAAWSDGGKKETNDKFLLFSAQLKKPAKPSK